MQYNFKRALGISFLLYVATFIIALAAGTLMGEDMSSMDTVSDSMWYVGMVAAVVVTALFTMWYFKNPSIVPSAKSGFYFGFTVIILSTLLDWATFTFGTPTGTDTDLSKYYGDYRFWIILVLVIVTAKLVGHMKGAKNRVA